VRLTTLKALRLSEGLTQEELCQQTGLYQERLSLLERQLITPSASETKKLESHFERSVDELLSPARLEVISA